jgi:polyhydroxybutyrate depolymerase
MRRARRVLAWVGAGLALLLGLAVYLLYAPAPPEPKLSARPSKHVLQIGGRQRPYLLYTPADLAPSPPLLVVFHGSMGNPAGIRVATGYGLERLADRHGFILAYPQGHDGHWNDCRKAADYAARRLGIDDVGFFEALVDRLRRERGVDPARVFVAGLSNGGHFAFRLALERPERIAGAAVFAASLPTPDNNDCRPLGPPPPLLLVNGTSDPINPFQGGTVTLFGFGNRGSVLSARDTARHFAGPQAGAPVTDRLSPRARGDGTWAERSVWRSPGRSEVALLAIHGGGHIVPQPAHRPPRLLGRATSAIDGPEEAWAFFRRQPPRRAASALPEPPPGG